MNLPGLVRTMTCSTIRNPYQPINIKRKRILSTKMSYLIIISLCINCHGIPIPHNFKIWIPMVGCQCATAILGRFMAPLQVARHFKWLLSWFSRTAHTNIWLSGCPLGPAWEIPWGSKPTEFGGASFWVPLSGKHTKNIKKQWTDPPCLMGKSTISMAIFNSYLSLWCWQRALHQATCKWRLGLVEMGKNTADLEQTQAISSGTRPI